MKDLSDNVFLDSDTGELFYRDGETVPESSIAELGRNLPSMLVWLEEPGVRAGDEFVFRWGKVHGRHDVEHGEGEPFTASFPDVLVRLLGDPVRHRKGWWQASFVRVGFDRTEPFLKAGPFGGTTPNPLRSIDREVTLVEVDGKSDREADREDALLRRSKRIDEARRDRRPGRFERQQRRAA